MQSGEMLSGIRPSMGLSIPETYRELGFNVLTLFVTGLITYGGVLFSVTHSLSPSVCTLAVWPVNALLSSLVLLFPPRRRSCLLFAGFLGICGGRVLAGYITPTAFLLAFLNIVEVILAVTLVERSNARNAKISLQQMFARLVFWAGFVAPALSAALMAGFLLEIEHAPFLETWALRFMSDGLGMLIIMAPLMLISRIEDLPDLKRLDKLFNTLAVPVIVTALDVFAFRQQTLPLLFTVFPTLMFATFRLHFVGTAVMVFVTSCLAIYYMQILNVGPIALVSGVVPAERVLLLQVFLATVALTMLPLSVILRHRSELRRDLARRVAELAEAYERERLVARTFQQAALDENLPVIPGLVFDAVYQPARADALVGGDWYDAFRLPDGRIVLSIGDVAGSGLHAAVLMGSVRQSIRTAALINPDPMAILNAVDRIVRAMDREFVTAFVAMIDPLFFELVYAGAGHPPPLLRAPDGSVRRLAQYDLPLGLRLHDTESSVAIDVEPGSLLAFYTDGLTEFDRDPIEGEKRLSSVMNAILEPAHAARDLYKGVLDGYIQHDDVAILMVSFERALSSMDEEASIVRWEFNVNDVDAAYEERKSFLSVLAKAGFTVSELASAELVFGELLGNIVRYVGGRVAIYLDMSGEAAVLHVLDQGYGFEYNPRLPKDPMSERGRGLFLVSTFAEEVSLSRRKGQGSHARVVLCGRIRMHGISRRSVRPVPAVTLGKLAPMEEERPLHHERHGRLGGYEGVS